MDNPAVPEISPEEATSAIANGAFLLDVREPEEWEAGHAGVAHHIALGELGARLAELPEDRDIVVVCRLGGRSLMAATALRNAGFPAVNLAGGMQAWEAAGYDVLAEGGQGIVI